MKKRYFFWSLVVVVAGVLLVSAPAHAQKPPKAKPRWAEPPKPQPAQVQPAPRPWPRATSVTPAPQSAPQPAPAPRVNYPSGQGPNLKSWQGQPPPAPVIRGGESPPQKTGIFDVLEGVRRDGAKKGVEWGKEGVFTLVNAVILIIIFLAIPGLNKNRNEGNKDELIAEGWLAIIIGVILLVAASLVNIKVMAWTAAIPIGGGFVILLLANSDNSPALKWVVGLIPVILLPVALIVLVIIGILLVVLQFWTLLLGAFGIWGMYSALQAAIAKEKASSN